MKRWSRPTRREIGSVLPGAATELKNLIALRESNLLQCASDRIPIPREGRGHLHRGTQRDHHRDRRHRHDDERATRHRLASRKGLSHSG